MMMITTRFGTALLTCCLCCTSSLFAQEDANVDQAAENVAESNEDAAKEEATVEEIKAQDLTLSVPTTWTKEKPSNNLRLAQFQVPAAEGIADPTEFVVFPPFGGTINQNIERWIAQFNREGRTVKMLEGECEQGKYVLVDLEGTYKKPDGPPFLRKTIDAPGYRMIAVILTAKEGGNYFLKITGPTKSVEGAAADFRKTFGGDADKEKPREI